MYVEIDVFKRWCRRLWMVIIYVLNGDLSLALRQDRHMTMVRRQLICTWQHTAFRE